LLTPSSQTVTAGIESLLDRITALQQRIAELEASGPDDRISLVVFSGDLDRILAAFIIATGAAAMGQQVDMYFTFWA
jgi:hypothetical protein